MRFMFIKGGAAIGVVYMASGAILKPILRKATGWENFEE